MNSINVKRCAHIAVATLAAGLAVSHAWGASPWQEARSVVVRYTDLDLSRPRDARVLYDRIHAAARLVCRNVGDETADLARLSEYRRCVHQAVANAVANVSSTEVTQLYARYNR
jgi:UrcA family protein